MVIVYRQAMAVANLARQQIVIEARLISAESQPSDIESRLQIVEANQGDDSRYITNAQAVQVAQGDYPSNWANAADAMNLGGYTGSHTAALRFRAINSCPLHNLRRR